MPEEGERDSQTELKGFMEINNPKGMRGHPLQYLIHVSRDGLILLV